MPVLHAVLAIRSESAPEKSQLVYTGYFLALLSVKFNRPAQKHPFLPYMRPASFSGYNLFFIKEISLLFIIGMKTFFIKKIGESKKNASFFITEMMQKNTSFNYVPLKAEKVMSRNNATI